MPTRGQPLAQADALQNTGNIICIESYCLVRAIVIIVDGAGLQEGLKQRDLEEIQPFPWITFFNITMDCYKKSQSIWRAFIYVILVYYF